MALTDAACRNAKPKPKLYKLSDEKGLYLEVTPAGGKYWRVKYRFGGKEKRITLGEYPIMGLAQAREGGEIQGRRVWGLADVRKMLRADIDPGAAKQEAKREHIAQNANTFELLAREWHAQQKGNWKPDHADRIMRALEMDAFPWIGKTPMNEITVENALSMIRQVEGRGALNPAEDLRGWSARVFQYAIQTDRAEQNPFRELGGGVLKKPEDKRRPALLPADMPEFLAKLENYPGDLQVKLALKLLVLTFTRNGELRGAKWSEFDLERREWRIPSERMKMGIEHIVPLSDQALAVLEQIKTYTHKNRFLFPSRLDSRKTISENTLNKGLAVLGYKGRVTANGFRATASGLLNEQGFNPDAIERQLAHKERNKVRAAYTHQAQYLADRHKLMQWWAVWLDQQRAIGQGANIVSLNMGLAG